jgi:Protein of unknown function (DUF998)
LIGGKDIPWPSSLAAGPYGWAQIANFLLAGVLILLFAGALRRALPARRASIVAFAALTSAGIAIAASAFPVDATMIATGNPSTWHGWIHGTAFLVALPSILIAPLATALAVRGDSRWRRREQGRHRQSSPPGATATTGRIPARRPLAASSTVAADAALAAVVDGSADLRSRHG